MQMQSCRWGIKTDCPCPDDCVHDESARGNSIPHGRNDCSPNKINLDTPLLPNVPGAPRRNSNLGSVLAGLGLGISRLPRPASPGTHGRTSCPGHAVDTDGGSGMRCLPSSRSAPLTPSNTSPTASRATSPRVSVPPTPPRARSTGRKARSPASETRAAKTTAESGGIGASVGGIAGAAAGSSMKGVGIGAAAGAAAVLPRSSSSTARKPACPPALRLSLFSTATYCMCLRS